MRRLVFLLSVSVAGLGVTGAMGQGDVARNMPIPDMFPVSEFRAGILAQSIDEPGPDGFFINLARIEDISFEILFLSPDMDVFRWLGSPRPNMGITINLGGLESMAFLGLTWQVPVLDGSFYLEGTLGGAVQNGILSGASYPARNLGCSVLFYEAAGIGANVFDSMTATLVLEHASSANLCMPNQGLTNLGIRIGYKF